MLIDALAGNVPEAEKVRNESVLLAYQHGVLFPLEEKWSGKVDPDSPSWQKLQDLLRTQALEALNQTQALVKLLAEGRSRSVGIFPFKGPVLSLFLYGRIEWRPCVDLDLIIDPGQAREAYTLIRDLGYEPDNECCPRTPEEAATIDIDWYFHHPETGLLLDVQTSVIGPGYPQGLNALYMGSNALHVPLTGQQAGLPDPEVLYLYLAFHAARHRGERLMWRQDLQALLDKFPGFDWQRCRALARGCGLEKFLDWAEEWRRSGTAPGARWTGAAPQRTLLNTDGLFHLLGLHSGPANKWRYLLHMLFAPCHKDWLALPPGTPAWRLQLYRYPRLLRRAWERAFARKRGAQIAA